MQLFIEWVLKNPLLSILAAGSLVEFSPVKVYPLKWMAKIVGSLINKYILNDVIAQLKKFGEELGDLKTEVQEEKVENARWCVLDFANSCMQGRRHTYGEWNHAIKTLDWYEMYVEKNNIKNGEIDDCDKYLRELYHERRQKGDFL